MSAKTQDIDRAHHITRTGGSTVWAVVDPRCLLRCLLRSPHTGHVCEEYAS